MVRHHCGYLVGIATHMECDLEVHATVPTLAGFIDEQKAKVFRMAHGRGRKRVLAIVAGILVARHLKTADDLFDSKPSPRTESMVAAAVRWAERIMKKIDDVFPT